MKLVYALLLGVFIFGCSSKEVSLYDEPKLLQIKCNIYGDTLNTFENYYYGRTSGSNDNKITFFLGLEEQNEIIKELNTYKFFELPDTIIRFKMGQNDQGMITIIGDWYEHLCEIEINGHRKTVYMSNSYNFESEESIRFEKIMDVIYNIIEKRNDLKKFHKGIWWI